MASEDTEITLGAGKLLGLFFMLVAICGVFFAIGYSLGKSSAREQALNDRPAEAAEASASTGAAATAEKPSAAVQGKAVDQQQSSGDSADHASPDLTFYQAVKQKGPDVSTPSQPASKTAAANNDSATVGTTPAASPAPAKEAAGTEAASPPATTPIATAPAGDYLVQIAAVSHEEDAAALAGALRKKSYSASVVNNPAARDKLYHVVIGPYASLQDAEAMKLKLKAEGYNPIVKR